jgi:hypothetical protein
MGFWRWRALVASADDAWAIHVSSAGCNGGTDLIVAEKKMEHKEMRVDEDELEAVHAKLMEKRVKSCGITEDIM